MLSDNWKYNKKAIFPQVTHPELKIFPNAKLFSLTL